MAKLTAAERDVLPAREFTFLKSRKEPIEDDGHVASAIRRFMTVRDVTDEERDQAWKRIQAAAKKFDVEMQHEDWREPE